MINSSSRTSVIAVFNSHVYRPFQNPRVYITHNSTQLMGDITGGHLSDDMQLHLEPQKTSYCFSYFSASPITSQFTKKSPRCLMNISVQ